LRLAHAVFAELVVHIIDGFAVVLLCCLNIVKVLRSEEGRQLRATHQENVRYLRGKLLEAGLPVIHTPSHIIPIHVGNHANLVFITSADLV